MNIFDYRKQFINRYGTTSNIVGDEWRKPLPLELLQSEGEKEFDLNKIPQLYNSSAEKSKLFPLPALDEVPEQSPLDVNGVYDYLISDPQTYSGTDYSINKPMTYANTLERYNDLSSNNLTYTNNKQIPSNYTNYNEGYGELPFVNNRQDYRRHGQSLLELSKKNKDPFLPPKENYSSNNSATIFCNTIISQINDINNNIADQYKTDSSNVETDISGNVTINSQTVGQYKFYFKNTAGKMYSFFLFEDGISEICNFITWSLPVFISSVNKLYSEKLVVINADGSVSYKNVIIGKLFLVYIPNKENYTDIYGTVRNTPDEELSSIYGLEPEEHYTSIYGSVRYPLENLGIKNEYPNSSTLENSSYGGYLSQNDKELPGYQEQLDEIRMEDPEQNLSDFAPTNSRNKFKSLKAKNQFKDNEFFSDQDALNSSTLVGDDWDALKTLMKINNIDKIGDVKLVGKYAFYKGKMIGELPDDKFKITEGYSEKSNRLCNNIISQINTFLSKYKNVKVNLEGHVLLNNMIVGKIVLEYYNKKPLHLNIYYNGIDKLCYTINVQISNTINNIIMQSVGRNGKITVDDNGFVRLNNIIIGVFRFKFLSKEKFSDDALRNFSSDDISNKISLDNMVQNLCIYINSVIDGIIKQISYFTNVDQSSFSIDDKGNLIQNSLVMGKFSDLNYASSSDEYNSFSVETFSNGRNNICISISDIITKFLQKVGADNLDIFGNLYTTEWIGKFILPYTPYKNQPKNLEGYSEHVQVDTYITNLCNTITNLIKTKLDTLSQQYSGSILINNAGNFYVEGTNIKQANGQFGPEIIDGIYLTYWSYTNDVCTDLTIFLNGQNNVCNTIKSSIYTLIDVISKKNNVNKSLMGINSNNQIYSVLDANHIDGYYPFYPYGIFYIEQGSTGPQCFTIAEDARLVNQDTSKNLESYNEMHLFNTIMKDDPTVEEQSKNYSTVQYPAISLPSSFDGREVWKNFIVPVRNQGGCGSCWAFASSETLSDRYNIWTGRLFVNLSGYSMLLCDGVIKPGPPYNPNVASQKNNEAHSKTACNGNTLYNAMDYIYEYGLLESSCFNQSTYSARGFKLPTDPTAKYPQDLPTCEQVVGNDFNSCLPPPLVVDPLSTTSGKSSTKGGSADNSIPTAARYYRTSTSYNITDSKQSDDEKETAIKTELMKNGPVWTAFQVPSDFMTFNFNNTNIYDNSAKLTSIGGHSVEIMGWGNKNGVDYWIVRNSWGTGWGDQGYFYLKINCGLQMEDNTVSLIPDLPINIKDYPSMKISSKIRNKFAVDEKTFYRKSAITLIKQGKLKGDLTPVLNFDLNLTNFLAYKVKTSKTKKYLFYIVLIILIIIIILIIKKK